MSHGLGTLSSPSEVGITWRRRRGGLVICRLQGGPRLDLEMGRRLSMTGCVVRSACSILDQIAHSFVLRVLDTLGGRMGSEACPGRLN